MKGYQEGSIRKGDRRSFHVFFVSTILFIVLFFLLGSFNVVNAASTKFIQGKGYQTGAYDAYGDQPTSLNWNRQSRFNGSSIPSLKWAVNTGDEVTASPVIAKDGTVYIGSENGYLYAFASDGKIKWKYKTKDSISASAAVGSDGTIYVTSGMTLYAVTSKGKTKWTYSIKSESYSSLWLNSPPAIGKDGTIYVGVSGFLETGSTTVAKGKLLAISNMGKLKWQFKTSSIDATPTVASNGTIYITDVYYGSSGSFVSLSGYVYAVDPNGKQKWKYEIGSYTSSSVALGADGTLYVGSEDEYFYAINPSTGRVKWKVRLNGDITGTAAVGKNGLIYIGTHEGRLYALDSKGNIKWEYKAKEDIKSSPLVDAKGVIYFGSDDNYLYGLTPDGKLKWKASTSGHVISSPAISQKGDIYVGSQDGKLYAYNSSGKRNYTFSGKVLDKKTKKPVAKATIFIAGKQATTNSTGQFTITGIPTSKYVLTINQTGYYTYTNDNYNVSTNLSNKTFYLEQGGVLTTNPTKGVALTTVKVSGKGLPIDESGEIFLDANKNKLKDDDEPYAWVRTSNIGEFSDVSMQIPELKVGKYEILYTSDSVEQDPDSVKAAIFELTQTQAEMTLTPSKGAPHTKIKITGSLFPSNINGTVYFDKNKNGKWEYEEPYTYVSTNSQGAFQDAYLTAPSAAAGDYPIRFSASSGSLTVPSATFTLEKSNAALSVSVGNAFPHEVVTVSGSGFVPGESGMVYFDMNNNGKYDYSNREPYQYITTNSVGAFNLLSFGVPDVKTAGTYKIRFESNIDVIDVTPASITISVTPARITAESSSVNRNASIKITGTKFPKNEYGYIYIDLNDNEQWDYSPYEPYGYVSTDTNGNVQTTLTISSDTPVGTYKVRYQSNSSYGELSVPAIQLTIK